MMQSLYYLSLLLILPQEQLPSSSTNCALNVRVLSSQEELADNILVELIDSRGEVVSSARTVKGEIRFCDFGFGQHSVLVGRGLCYPIRISGITLDPERTISLIAKLNSCIDGHHMSGYYCDLILRVQNETRQPVAGASVRVVNSNIRKSADGYGRIRIDVYPREIIPLEVTAAGYSLGRFFLRCPAPKTITETLVLSPLPVQ